MGKLQARGDVAGRIDPRHVGAQALVNKYPTPLHRNTLFLKAHAHRIWPAANGN